MEWVDPVSRILERLLSPFLKDVGLETIVLPYFLVLGTAACKAYARRSGPKREDRSIGIDLLFAATGVQLTQLAQWLRVPEPGAQLQGEAYKRAWDAWFIAQNHIDGGFRLLFYTLLAIVVVWLLIRLFGWTRLPANPGRDREIEQHYGQDVATLVRSSRDIIKRWPGISIPNAIGILGLMAVFAGGAGAS